MTLKRIRILHKCFQCNYSSSGRHEKTQKKLIPLISTILTILIVPALFVNFNKDQLGTSSAFKDHYVPFTKKGEECLALDQELDHQSKLLAGTMILARTELNRLVGHDFEVSHNYEYVIRSAISNFDNAQESHSAALKGTSKCWRELNSLIEETSIAMGAYEELRKSDPTLVRNELALNEAEQELRTALLEPLDAEKLYEGFVKMTIADPAVLKSIIMSFDGEFQSLIAFREKMAVLTSQRVALRSRYYESKKKVFAEVLSSDISNGFFIRTLWPF